MEAPIANRRSPFFMSPSWIFPALLTASWTGRHMRALFDNSFAGIHQLAPFDWAMLIPYFGILFILSIYGVHRYEVIRTYFKHRRNAVAEPPQQFQQLPRVTI